MRLIALAHGPISFGDQICGISNLVTIAEETGEDLIVFAPTNAGAYTRHKIFTLMENLSKGTIHLFQNVTAEKRKNPTIVEEICRAIKINETFQLKSTYISKEYLKFNLNKLDLNSIENIDIPKRPYITSQFDANFRSRCVTNIQKKNIINNYISMGYNVIDIGGDDSGLKQLDNGIDITIKIMANAVGHIGVDSGMAHLAMCMRNPVHVYTAANGVGLKPLRKHGAIISYPDKLIKKDFK